jgi:hypothetical protein
MEILQVVENEKFLNTVGKFHTWNVYKTNKNMCTLHSTPLPHYTVTPYRTILQYVVHKSYFVILWTYQEMTARVIKFIQISSKSFIYQRMYSYQS